MEEIWKDIIGYDGRYQISNLGRVKSLCYHNGTKSRILKLRENQSGYCIVNLDNPGDNKGKLKTVHRLVAQAFIKNPYNYPQVNHKDENKTNNNVNNLEWCDNRYNTIYSIRLHKDRYKNCGKYIRTKKINRKRGPYKYHKRIRQLDINKNTTKYYENLRDVCVKNRYNQWAIAECCKGNRETAYGYKWEFAD